MENDPDVLGTAEKAVGAQAEVVTPGRGGKVDEQEGVKVDVGISESYPPIKEFLAQLPMEDPEGFAIMNMAWDRKYLEYLRGECRLLDKLLAEGVRSRKGSLNFAAPARQIREAESTSKKLQKTLDKARGRKTTPDADDPTIRAIEAELAATRKNQDEVSQSAFRSHIQLVRDRWIFGVRNEISWHKNSKRWQDSPGAPRKEEGYAGLPSVSTVDPTYFELITVPHDLSPVSYSDPDSSRAVCQFLDKLYAVSITSPEKDRDGFDDGRKIPFYALLRRPHDSGTAWGRKNMVVDIILEKEGKPKVAASTPGGFWEPDVVTMFLLRFQKAAELLKMRWWHAIYNDYRVIERVNDRLNVGRAKRRIFVGYKGNITSSVDAKGRFTGKANYHGPYPLGIIHIHLDLIP